MTVPWKEGRRLLLDSIKAKSLYGHVKDLGNITKSCRSQEQIRYAQNTFHIILIVGSMWIERDEWLVYMYGVVVDHSNPEKSQ